MPKDRTEELRAESANSSQKYKLSRKWSKDQEEVVSLTTSYKLPSITKSSKKEQESLDLVFKDVNLILSWIETIKEDTVMLKQCHRIVLHSTRVDPNTKDRIQHLMANIRSYCARTRGGLDNLFRRKESTRDYGVRRVIETQHSILKKSYSDAVEDYQAALSSHKQRNEDIIKQHLLIVLGLVLKKLPCVPADKEVTSEQLSSLLDSEDTAVFADDFLKDTAAAKLLLQEARIRHSEIIALEREIIEIRELFYELAHNINAQGELIDRIEYHVQMGADKANRGMEELEKAKRHAARARKKKFLLYVCLAIVLGVIFLSLLVYFSSSSE